MCDIRFLKQLLLEGAEENKVGVLKAALRLGLLHQKLDLLMFIVEGGGIDVNCIINNDDNDDEPLLFMAIREGYTPNILYLLRQPEIDVYKTNSSGESPLHLAIKRRNALEIILRLVSLGCDINRCTRSGYNPLMIASCSGHVDAVKFLVEQGADKCVTLPLDDSTMLLMAVEHRRPEVVHYLAQLGVDLDKANRTTGLTPLLEAIVSFEFGRVVSLRIVESLLEGGVDRDKPDNDGNTPLHTAARRSSRIEVLKVIMRYGANLDARNQLGQLPIDLAGNDEVRKAILDEPGRRNDHTFKRICEEDPLQHAKKQRGDGVGGEEDEDEEEEDESDADNDDDDD